MNCESVRTHLLDFAHNETGLLRSWAIRRHLTRCTECAAELVALQQFQATLRRADLVQNIPVLVPFPRRTPHRAFAAAAAGLLVGGLFLLPAFIQNTRNAQNPGAAIAAALGRVNTWHFVGWKLIDGKQVPWEIWGRRAPWLYYERVGDTVTWSDGKQRLRVFAPNPALKRPQGLIIKTIVDQSSLDLGFLEEPAYQTLVSSRPAGSDFGDGATHLYQQTLTLARFRRQDPSGVSSGVNANKLYTIGKRDWLPTTYQLHFDSRTFARDTEYLGVRYDVDLPKAVLSPPFADGYSVVDFTPSAKRASGFQVIAKPMGVDVAGNIVIAVRGWLGESRLTPGSTFSLNVQPYNGRFSGLRRGQPLKYLYATNASLPPGSDISLPFAPLEPLKPSALPDTFLLSLSASPEIQVRSSDLIYSDGSEHPVTRTESLISEPFHWPIRLPKPDAHPSFSFPSAYDLAEQRRAYYFLGYDYHYTALKQVAPQLVQAGAMNRNGTVGMADSDGSVRVNMKTAGAVEAVTKRHPGIFKAAEQQFRARAVFWQQRKLALLPTGGATHEESYQNRLRHSHEIELLAVCYNRAGDKEGQDRTLRQLIQECQSLPNRGGLLRRQAEWSLHTGQFPGDAKYAGPS